MSTIRYIRTQDGSFVNLAQIVVLHVTEQEQGFDVRAISTDRTFYIPLGKYDTRTEAESALLCIVQQTAKDVVLLPAAAEKGQAEA